MDAATTTPGRLDDPEPGFTEEQVRAIVAAAACTDEAARTRLAFQVQKWSSTRRYLQRLGEQRRLSAKARQELLALAEIAEAYARALDRLSPEQRDYLIGNFGGSLPWLRDPRMSQRNMAPNNFSAWIKDAVDVHRGAATAKRGVRAGHPKNPFNKAIIVEELARMYEAATQASATRRVAREAVNGEYDYGPFHEFAAAVWVASFGSKRGLSTAEKEWARLRRQRRRNPVDYEVAGLLGMAEIPSLPTE
jgi:hypothetical protein